jgi:hypothetical protein
MTYLVIGTTGITNYEALDRLYDKGWKVYECKSDFPDYVALIRIEVCMPYGYELVVKKVSWSKFISIVDKDVPFRIFTDYHKIWTSGITDHQRLIETIYYCEFSIN